MPDLRLASSKRYGMFRVAKHQLKTNREAEDTTKCGKSYKMASMIPCGPLRCSVLPLMLLRRLVCVSSHMLVFDSLVESVYSLCFCACARVREIERERASEIRDMVAIGKRH